MFHVKQIDNSAQNFLLKILWRGALHVHDWLALLCSHHRDVVFEDSMSESAMSPRSGAPMRRPVGQSRGQ